MTIGPPEWLPLDAAFVRARDALGSPELAACDLLSDLISGRLPSAIRQIEYDYARQMPVESQTGELKPATWQKFLLHPKFGSEIGVNICARTDAAAPLRGVYVFVRAVALNRLYPASAAKTEQNPAPTGFPRKDTRGGSRLDIDWEKVLIAAAILMVQHKYRRPVDLKTAVYKHFREE